MDLQIIQSKERFRQNKKVVNLRYRYLVQCFLEWKRSWKIRHANQSILICYCDFNCSYWITHAINFFAHLCYWLILSLISIKYGSLLIKNHNTMFISHIHTHMYMYTCMHIFIERFIYLIFYMQQLNFLNGNSIKFF